MKTWTPKKEDITNDWLVVDAENLVLGRLASEVAARLRGKHKAEFAPHMDMGDFVVVVNADKIRVTGNKRNDKFYHRHTNHPGGLKSIAFRDLQAKKPEEIIKIAVRGMLPKNTLGRQMLRKLKIYAGPSHPHESQNPKALEL